MRKFVRWLKEPYRRESWGRFQGENGQIIELGAVFTRLDDLKRLLVCSIIVIGAAAGIAALIIRRLG